MVEIKLFPFAKYAKASSDIDSLFARSLWYHKSILPVISREMPNGKNALSFAAPRF